MEKHNVEWELLQRFERGNIGVELNILRLSIPRFSVQIVSKNKNGEWRPRAFHCMAAAGLIHDLLVEAEAVATNEAQLAEDAYWHAYWQMKNERYAQRDARDKSFGGSPDENRRRIKQQKFQERQQRRNQQH